MAAIRKTRRAKADLKRIWRYIAVDNPAGAAKLLARIESRLAQLAAFPYSGGLRPDVDPACRALVVQGYRVLYAYDEVADHVIVVAVIEPSRLLPEGLGDLEV